MSIVNQSCSSCYKTALGNHQVQLVSGSLQLNQLKYTLYPLALDAYRRRRYLFEAESMKF